MPSKTWIALFRGINVGGHRKLPMKELVAELEDLGLSAVQTYIQSGNAIFRSTWSRFRRSTCSIPWRAIWEIPDQRRVLS